MSSSSNLSASTSHHAPNQKALVSKDNSKEAPLAVITGGSGFLGSYLCKILAEQGWRVLALSRSGKASKALPFSHHALEYRSLDILDLNALIRMWYNSHKLNSLLYIPIDFTPFMIGDIDTTIKDDATVKGTVKVTV